MNRGLKIFLYVLLALLCFGLGYGVSYIASKNVMDKKEENKVTTTKKIETVSKEEKAFEKILNNEMQFNATRWADTKVEKYYLKEYTPEESMGYVIDKYTYLDMDGNGTKELIIMGTITNNRNELLDGMNLVFNYENGDVNCYLFSWRGLSDLSTDGSYMVSGGASSSGIMRIKKFGDLKEEDQYEEEELAINEGDNYKLSGKIVSEEEYTNYLKDRDAKKEPEWKEYK